MLTIHSIVAIPTKSPADDALAYALDRWLPWPEPHELERVRERLRERGFDVLGLVRADRASELAGSVNWLAGLLEDNCTNCRVMTEEEADAIGQARALLDRVRRAKP